MWLVCFSLSVACVVIAALLPFVINRRGTVKKRHVGLFNSLLVGAFAASLLMLIPVHLISAEKGIVGAIQTFLLSFFDALQMFALEGDLETVRETLIFSPAAIREVLRLWVTVLYVCAPFFTFGFVLSLFKNISAYLKYIGVYFKPAYIFSELNEKSLALAKDIKKNHKNAAIVFTDVFEDNKERVYELVENAKNIGAICFKKDILVVNFKRHSKKKPMYFFAMGENETENLNHSLKLIEFYKNRVGTNIYVFSTKIESELLLASVDKGEIKVRRVNEVLSLINCLLYDRGEIIFESAREGEDGKKHISVVVVGMGNHGTEMVKALTWFGQMDGYTVEINAFDKDPLAKEKFMALAPELMSERYNGKEIEGEAYYKINVHSGVDVQSISFAEKISKITDATYVMVALGNDDVNISTAVNLRMYFERMKIHPVIQAIVYNPQQRKALDGIKNYRGQQYDIEFIGDVESSFSENVIIDSELEDEALQRHLKWGEEKEFWTYEYNYRSSMASAIHFKARIKCGMPGAGKKGEDLTVEERDFIEDLEHRRWNAYMRSEGYVYSGSKDSSSRNDLGKMHHNLVYFGDLSDEDKRKDSSVGSK